MDWIIQLKQVPQGKIVINVSSLIWQMIRSLELLERLLTQLHLQFQCISSLITNMHHISMSVSARKHRSFVLALENIQNREAAVYISNAFSLMGPNHCLSLPKEATDRGNLYPTFYTAETQWTSMSALIPDPSRSWEKELLPHCLPSTEDALQLCLHKTSGPLCWDWCSLPLSAWCLCCPLASPRQLHKMRLDLTVFQFGRWNETVSGGSRPMGKGT